MVGDIRVQDCFEPVEIELLCMRALAARGQIHYGYHNLVMQPMMGDALS